MLSDKNKQRVAEIDKISGRARNILVVTHRNADGDAIGSALAWQEYLRSKGKDSIVVTVGGAPKKFMSLPGTEEIVRQENGVEWERFDLVVVLDTGSIDYTGMRMALEKKKKADRETLFVVIDHHISNRGWGDVNLIETGSSSTAEILFDYFRQVKVGITKWMATSLLVGILTDTGVFLNSGTTGEAMRTVADLVALGGKYNYALKMICRDKTKEDLRVWGKILSKIVKNNKLDIAYTVISRDDLDETAVMAADGVSNFIASLGESRISLVLSEIDLSLVKVSLRSLDGKTSVLRMAEWFGGGGHVAAAGFIIKGRLEKAGNYWQVV